MKASLPRRLLAGVAGLAVGLAGAMALTAPAHSVIFPHPVEPGFFDGCDGTTVVLANEDFQYSWTISVAGTQVWPQDGDDLIGANDTFTHFVPAGAGEIVVDIDFEAFEYHPQEHTWSAPPGIDCEELPGPTHTPATCDDPATITMPEFPETAEPPLTHVPEDQPLPLQHLTLRLNGEVVEQGSTHTVEPGTHTVTASFDIEIVLADKTVSYRLHVKTWTIDITAPDCKLPDTGAPSGLIAVGAVLVLALGGAMYVVARRRRIRFTA
jgi:LPXTG-motif cell wall-anchored protein